MAGSRSWDDIGYREAIENCRTWNAQMGHGRRERLPFFDQLSSAYFGSIRQSHFNTLSFRLCQVVHIESKWREKISLGKVGSESRN